MSPADRLLRSAVTVDEATATALSRGSSDRYTVEVMPPRAGDLPASLDRFVKGITEYETAWFGLQNRSPVSAYELRRPTPERLHLQFSVPSARLERKVRSQLAENVPGVGFAPGEDGLPITAGDTLGGGVLTTARQDWFPLRTDFDVPPINSVVSLLHRHAMPDSRILVQVVFQPVARRSIANWWWTRQARRTAQALRRDRAAQQAPPQRPATPRERTQATRVEAKAASARFTTGIRILIVGAGEATLSRVKEVTGGFNVFEDPATGQYLKTRYLRTVRTSRLLRFAAAVRDRAFRGWALPFQTSPPELAALVSLPDLDQENITTAQP